MILGDYRESFFFSVGEGNRNVHACAQDKICRVESTCGLCFVEKSFVFAVWLRFYKVEVLSLKLPQDL